MDLSSVFDKKWGILIKKESESLIFGDLKIPRDYCDLWRMNMNFSAEIIDDKLVIKRKEEDSLMESWEKKLDSFELKKTVETSFVVDEENQYKIFLWKALNENILMVYSKQDKILCAYTILSRAYLRLFDRVCKVISITLDQNALKLSLYGGIVNQRGLNITRGRLLVGSRSSRSYDIPVISDDIKKIIKSDLAYVREFQFSIEELTKEMQETSSRLEVEVTVDGIPVRFPIKISLPKGKDAKYVHVPMTSFFYKNYALQIKHSQIGNVLFICRPMEEIEKKINFRFWESEFVSKTMYKLGFWVKKHSTKKISLFYEKFCEKAEEGTYEVFEIAQKRNPKGAFFIINKNAPDYQKIKKHPNVVKQYSGKYYWLLFRANAYISTETPLHLNIIRSNNLYFRRTIAENDFIFLQHGITYMKYHGKNSPFIAGKEMEPNYIIVNSEKEKNVIHEMLNIDKERILKTGMGIFSKIDYKHISQSSEDIAVIMLTWKPYEENMSDFTQSSYYKNTLAIYHILKKYLQEDKIYIVIHPKTGELLENTPLSKNIWRKTISEILTKAKLLITDYSSVCYNSFYQGGGVVFFQEDIDFYEKENGKLIPKDDEYIGKRAFSLEELEQILKDGLKDHGIMLDCFRTKEFEQRYHTINEFSDGKNMERLCDKLIELKFI